MRYLVEISLLLKTLNTNAMPNVHYVRDVPTKILNLLRILKQE